MNFKTILFLGLMTLSFASLAGVNKYVLKSGLVVELQGINQSKGTAYYFDHEAGKRIYIDLKDASIEVNQAQGVKSGHYVVAKTQQGEQICKTFSVFANDMAHFGCQTLKFRVFENKDVLAYANYTAHLDYLLKEESQADGFSKNEVVRLKGKKLRIEAIFENGQVLLVPTGILSKLDASSRLLSIDTKLATTRDIEKL